MQLLQSRHQRGYTVVELASVAVVLAFLMSAVALIIGPMLRSQSQTQAKVDTVQAAAMAFYRIERDLRNTNSGDIYSCTTGATPSCSLAPSALTSTTAIVMPSAYLNGTGQFQLLAASGSPNWQGATVYWVDSMGNLDVAFDSPTGFSAGNELNATDAQSAVKDVTATGGTQLARFVELLSLGVPASPTQLVSFQMQAQSTVNGAANETTYRTDIRTRN